MLSRPEQHRGANAKAQSLPEQRHWVSWFPSADGPDGTVPQVITGDG